MSDSRSCPPICSRHGEAKVLRRDGRDRPLKWYCRPCHAAKQRRLRARQRARRATKGLARALDLRLATQRQVAEVDALVRTYGGWQAMFDALPMKDCARLAIRIAESADAAERQAAEQRRLEDVPENDPQMQRELVQMGLQYLHQHPEQLEPHVTSIIARKPSILRDALRHRTVKALMTQWGYRREDCPED